MSLFSKVVDKKKLNQGFLNIILCNWDDFLVKCFFGNIILSYLKGSFQFFFQFCFRCQQWFHFCENRHLSRLDKSRLNKYKVCHKHFYKKFIGGQHLRKSLLGKAVPTIRENIFRQEPNVDLCESGPSGVAQISFPISRLDSCDDSLREHDYSVSNFNYSRQKNANATLYFVSWAQVVLPKLAFQVRHHLAKLVG